MAASSRWSTPSNTSIRTLPSSAFFPEKVSFEQVNQDSRDAASADEKVLESEK